ncbi:MAG: hypothetical protein NVS3B20_12650 [Polyangiales bacterium]
MSRMARLITIPFSHYCEKARWAADWLGVQYREEAHLPFVHAHHAMRVSGKRFVPIWVTDDRQVLSDSTDIVNHLDAQARLSKPAERSLFPNDPIERSAAEAVEELCDAEVGVSSRAWAYDILLDDPRRLVAICGPHMGAMQRLAFRALAYPMSPVIRRGSHISRGSADHHLERLRASFAVIEQRLDGDRRYLVGDHFSIADLTFAALASPILMPEQHPTIASNPNLLPPGAAAVVREMRASRAGAHALRMYRDHRASTPGTRASHANVRAAY